MVTTVLGVLMEAIVIVWDVLNGLVSVLIFLGELLAATIIVIVESAITLGQILGKAISLVIELVLQMGLVIYEATTAIGEGLANAILWVVEKLGELWTALSTTASNVKNSLVTAMEGARDSLRAIWEEIKGFFANAISIPSNMFSGIGNSFVSVINRIIRAWNGLSFSLPSIDTKIPGIGTIGGFTVGTPNIAQVPGFAEGGVALPGDPFLAILGDNRTQREVIAPEDMLREVFRSELSGASDAGGLGGAGMTIEIGTINAAGMDAMDLAKEILAEASMRG